MTGEHPSLEQLGAVVDGTATVEEIGDIKAHLATCSACAETYASLENEAKLLAESMPAEEEAPAGLLNAVFEQTTRKKASGRRQISTRRRIAATHGRPDASRVWVYAGLAAAAAVVLAVVLSQVGSTPHPSHRTTASRDDARDTSPEDRPAPTAGPGFVPFDQDVAVAPRPDAVEPDSPADTPDGPPAVADADADVNAPPAEDVGPDATPSPPPAPRVAVPPQPATPRPRDGESIYKGAPIHVASFEGAVELMHAQSGQWFDAYVGAWLAPGDTVRTKYSRVGLRLESGSLVFVNRFTTFTWADDLETPGFDMAGGEVYVETVPADKGFFVETPHGIAVDFGTKFGVSTKKTGTTVVVKSGGVRAATDEGKADVSTGQEVLLARRTMPPGRIRRARNLSKTLAWVRTLREDLPQAKVAGLRALYRFDERAGAVVRDVSGVGAPLDLTIKDPGAAKWLAAGGLLVVKPTIVVSSQPATKVSTACMKTNAFTVETWITPLDRKQPGPGRLVSISVSQSDRHFTLGHGGPVTVKNASFHGRFRTTRTDVNGLPGFSTPRHTAKTEPTHLALTRAADGTAVIYVNGRPAASRKIDGTFAGWPRGYRLMLANEFSEDRPWLGTYHMVAIYDRALSQDEVRQLMARSRTVLGIE